ncbi:hypothetical protein ACFL23_02225, partial [Patescibacteria group bacterium]
MTLFFLLQTFLLIYISYLSGRLVLKILKFNPETNIKRFVYPIMLGYGVLGNFGLILALLGIYKQFYFYIFFLLIVFASRNIIYKKFLWITNLSDRLRDVKIIFKDNPFLKIIILLWSVFYLAISCMPSVLGSDGMAYHLPFAIDIINKSSIHFPMLNSLSYGHLPILTEIFYGIPILLFNNLVSFKIIQFIASIFLILLISDFTKKYLQNKILNLILIILILANLPFQKNALAGGFI